MEKLKELSVQYLQQLILQLLDEGNLVNKKLKEANSFFITENRVAADLSQSPDLGLLIKQNQKLVNQQSINDCENNSEIVKSLLEQIKYLRRENSIKSNIFQIYWITTKFYLITRKISLIFPITAIWIVWATENLETSITQTLKILNEILPNQR